jgi:hypothetical protein
MMLFNIISTKRINVRFPLNRLNPRTVPIGMPINDPIKTAVPETLNDRNVMFKISIQKVFSNTTFTPATVIFHRLKKRVWRRQVF